MRRRSRLAACRAAKDVVRIPFLFLHRGRRSFELGASHEVFRRRERQVGMRDLFTPLAHHHRRQRMREQRMDVLRIDQSGV